MTRLRIAAKIVQRISAPRAAKSCRRRKRSRFVRLVARSRHTPTQMELLFYRLSKVDAIVGAMARELFYPVCIAGRPPDGISSASSRRATAPNCWRPEPLVNALVHHRVLEKSLELHQSLNDRPQPARAAGRGTIARERPDRTARSSHGFRLSQHNVSLATFPLRLYDEFLPHAHNAALALSCDVLPVSDFARTLLLSPAQVEEHCRVARSHQLLAQHGRN
jgi:hypothetical protein